MSPLKLVLAPNPLLKQVSREVREDEFGTDLLNLTTNMLVTMVEEKGVGLAAVQVGDLRRILVANIDGRAVRMVNPRLLASNQTKREHRERCLSYPGIEKTTLRAKRISVEYRTPTGQVVTETFDGYNSIVIQHEMDHLDGKTIG